MEEEEDAPMQIPFEETDRCKRMQEDIAQFRELMQGQYAITALHILNQRLKEEEAAGSANAAGSKKLLEDATKFIEDNKKPL